MREEIFEVKNPNQATVDPSAFDSSGLQLAESLSTLVSGIGDLGVQLSSIKKSRVQSELQLKKQEQAMIKAAQEDFDEAVEKFGAEQIAKLYIENKNKKDDKGNYIGFDIFKDKDYYDDAPETFKEAYGEEKGTAVWKAYIDERNTRVLATAKAEVDSNIASYLSATSKEGKDFNYLNDEDKPSFDVLMSNTYGKYLNEGNHPTHLKNVLTPLSTYITEKTNTLNNEQNKTILTNQKNSTKDKFANTFSSFNTSLFNANNAFMNENPGTYKVPENQEDKALTIAKYLAQQNNAIVNNGTLLYGESKKDLSPIPDYLKDIKDNQVPNIFRKDLTHTEKINKVEELIDVLEALGDQENTEKMAYGGIYEIGETINEIEKLIDENVEEKRATDVLNLNTDFDAFYDGEFGKNSSNEDNPHRGLITILNDFTDLGSEDNSETRFNLIDEFNAAKSEVLKYYQKKLNDYYEEGIEDTMYKSALISNQSFFEKLKPEPLPADSDIDLLKQAFELQREGDPDALIKLLNDNPRKFSITDRSYFLRNPSKAVDAIKSIRSYVDSSTLVAVGETITIGELSIKSGNNELVMQLLEQMFLKKPSDFKQQGVEDKDKFNHWYEVLEKNGGDVAGNLFKLTSGDETFSKFKQLYMEIIQPIGIEINNE